MWTCTELSVLAGPESRTEAGKEQAAGRQLLRHHTVRHRLSLTTVSSGWNLSSNKKKRQSIQAADGRKIFQGYLIHLKGANCQRCIPGLPTIFPLVLSIATDLEETNPPSSKNTFFWGENFEHTGRTHLVSWHTPT